ncbi:MAG: succinate dehydrogenase [Candidatus Thermoplasmatota archaeon]|nr:succinate dehydrogenase [Candidatus Thermoplasmatota archaeon]
MATKAQDVHESGMFGTQRPDKWWVPPLIIAIGFSIFVVYSMWAGVLGAAHKEVLPTDPVSSGNHLLSPFFSPCLGEGCAGPFVVPFLEAIPISAAFWILWAPLGFRATCYYYRKAYYRAYFLDPAACAVEEGRQDYKGESAFPFILQNLHRYFLPFALLLVLFLSYDALLTFKFTDGFGVSIGSLVLTANVVLLGGYTFGCHSLRHLIGGKFDCMTCPAGEGDRKERTGYKGWKIVTWFNERHMLWAWLSLFWVGFTDLYVRLVSMGIIADVRLI